MSINAALTLIGATLLVLGLGAGLIRNRWYVSEPLVALAAGAGVALLVPDLLERVTTIAVAEQAARFTLTIALVDLATALPSDYVRRRWRVLLVMLGIVMPLMWLASSLIAWAVLGASWAGAMLLGSLVTPTDPVLAGSITTGRLAERSVPARLRRAILAESGANDALALTLVSLSLFMLGAAPSTTFTHWLVDVVVVEIAGGIAIGAVAGALTAKALGSASAKRDSDRASLVSVGLALAITLLGAARLVGSDGILAAFVAGLVLNRSLTGELGENKNQFHETVRRFFELPVFVLLGLALPWRGWAELGAPALGFAALVLVLRRLPVVWLVRRAVPPVRTRADALFVGWFGPVGVAALYYAALAVRRTGDESYWTVTTLVVAGSVLVHGLSSTALTRWFARRLDAPDSGEQVSRRQHAAVDGLSDERD